MGKASTLAQVIGVVLILVAAVFPSLHSFYLPTVYTSVVALAFFSGFHYIFHVARLMKEDDLELNKN